MSFWMMDHKNVMQQGLSPTVDGQIVATPKAETKKKNTNDYIGEPLFFKPTFSMLVAIMSHPPDAAMLNVSRNF